KSPWHFASVVTEKAAAVGDRGGGNHVAHAADRLLGAQVAAEVGHAGAHLARPQEEAGDAERPPLDRERPPQLVQGRLRRAIDVVALHAVAGHRCRQTGNADDFLCVPCCKFDFSAVASRSGASVFTTIAGSHASRVTAAAVREPPAPMPAFKIATSMGAPDS